MEKLQPIIRQRFWILLGLCLILGFWGYFKGQAAMVSATEARESALKSIESGVSNGNVPNDDYAKKLGEINKGFSSAIGDAVNELFEKQRAQMTWPEGRIAAGIPKVYRDTEHPISPTTTGLYYSLEYSKIIDDLWKRVEPVVPKPVPGTERSPLDTYTGPVTWTQKVYCDRASIPQKDIPVGKPVASDTVWDAQEDVWFTGLILDAIARINHNSDSPLNSVVRKVNRLELRGGDGNVDTGEASGEAGATGATDSAYSSMSPKNMGGMGAMSGGMGGMNGMGAASAIVAPPVEFDPSEELGSDAAPEESGGGEETGATNSAYSSMAMGGASDVPGLRWYKMDESAPFRERGFYLSVDIMQSQIPDFLIELLNSPWPIKIVRFQMGPNPDYNPMAGADMLAGGGEMGPMSRGLGMQSGMGRMGSMGGYSGSSMGGYSGSGAGRGPMGGRMGAMGGMGGGLGARRGAAGSGLQFINSPTDPFAGSLNSPDLVQLDILGIITFYVEAKADGTAATETPTVDTPAAPVEEVPATDANGEKPATEGATGEPGATPADGTTPPAGDGTPMPPVEGTPAPTDGTNPPAAPENPGTPAPEGTSNPATPAPAEPPATPPAETPPATDAPPAAPGS